LTVGCFFCNSLWFNAKRDTRPRIFLLNSELIYWERRLSSVVKEIIANEAAVVISLSGSYLSTCGVSSDVDIQSAAV
jgi:hypothetical protein